MKTTVVNIRRNEYDVYIGREGHGHDGYWGNPYSVTRDGGRERAIALYREYFYRRLRVDPEFAARVQELKGKRLGCFCAPKPCHGDIIADYLNIEPNVKPYVDELMAKGFYTFSSCDGGDGHSFKRRTIKINVDQPTVDDPYGYDIAIHGERRCYERFIDLCDFIEGKKWTYCQVLLVREYIVNNQNMPKANVHFELIWN